MAPKIKLLVVGLLAVAATLTAAGFWAASRAREATISGLSKKLKADVDLQELSVSFLPWPSATGKSLAIYPHNRRPDQPLIKVDRFEAHMGWWGLYTWNVSTVDLQGLVITVAPKLPGPRTGRKINPTKWNIPTLDVVRADGARLVIVPKKEGKEPLVWDMTQLKIDGFNFDRSMRYTTKLTNPIPPGIIDCDGHFGPWNADDFDYTPVDGKYTYNNANLDHFDGIGGILSAKGEFKGVMGRIETSGETDVPDFHLDVAKNPVHLKTKYHAIVDGTDGDTQLQPVEVEFGRTKLIAKGAVQGQKGRKGKAITLHVVTTQARIEDLLRLTVKGNNPPLRGSAHFNTNFNLPPGKQDILERLALDGAFGIGNVRFTGTVQQKVETLSQKAKGEPGQAPDERVLANLKGNFQLAKGSINLSRVNFTVPGATVDIAGSYGLESEQLDFQGHLIMDAKVSQTVKGYKSVLLKAVDPFFKNKQKPGSKIPIKIQGTREAPKFGLNF